jgi:16S rRNA processing protein RimM
MESGMLLAGEIGKPHGLTGEVYVVRISDDPLRFEPGSRLIHADGRELVVASSRPHRDRLLVKFEGFDDRDAAEGLRGTLLINSEEARTLEDDEYWPHELTGCAVVLADGGVVGEVSAVVPSPAHDLLQVKTSAGDRLVPVVKDIVVEVDVRGRRITIDPPEGLLD